MIKSVAWKPSHAWEDSGSAAACVCSSLLQYLAASASADSAPQHFAWRPIVEVVYFMSECREGRSSSTESKIYGRLWSKQWLGVGLAYKSLRVAVNSDSDRQSFQMKTDENQKIYLVDARPQQQGLSLIIVTECLPCLLMVILLICSFGTVEFHFQKSSYLNVRWKLRSGLLPIINNSWK